MPNDADYTITDLARLTGLTVRTIRYYLAQGLIPASGESGPGAHYGAGHLNRLELIKRLQTEYLPNAEIRRRLAALSDADVGEILSADASPAKAQESALDYVRGVLGTASASASASAASASREPEPQWLFPASRPSGAMPAPLVGAITPLAPSAPSNVTTVATDDDAQPEPPTLERSQWERLSLSPDVELHVRRPLSRQEQKRVDRLITIARQVLKEGRS